MVETTHQWIYSWLGAQKWGGFQPLTLTLFACAFFKRQGVLWLVEMLKLLEVMVFRALRCWGPLLWWGGPLDICFEKKGRLVRVGCRFRRTDHLLHDIQTHWSTSYILTYFDNTIRYNTHQVYISYIVNHNTHFVKYMVKYILDRILYNTIQYYTHF